MSREGALPTSWKEKTAKILWLYICKQLSLLHFNNFNFVFTFKFLFNLLFLWLEWHQTGKYITHILRFNVKFESECLLYCHLDWEITGLRIQSLKPPVWPTSSLPGKGIILSFKVNHFFAFLTDLTLCISNTILFCLSLYIFFEWSNTTCIILCLHLPNIILILH